MQTTAQVHPPELTLSVGALAAVASPASAAAGQHLAVDLGPTHPSRAGLLTIRISTTPPEPGGGQNECASADSMAGGPQRSQNLSGTTQIVSARVEPGHSHRAAEKLFEVRDYRQVLMLADRHDWSASIHGELLVANAAEALLGLPVPERAMALREALAAHARLESHLAFLQFVPFRLRHHGLVAQMESARSAGRDLLFALTGNRVHPMVVRLGGVAAEPTPAWCTAASQWAGQVGEVAGATTALIDSQAAREAAGGIGVLSPADVDALGLAGVVAAGSGVQRWVADAGTVPAAPTGDARSRFAAMALDAENTATRLAAAAERLSDLDGPTETPLSKIVKVPEGEVFVDRDAPMGIAGVHLVSRAGTTPWRLRLRTPTFANVQALQTALVGTPVERADWVIASLGHTIGDLDK